MENFNNSNKVPTIMNILVVCSFPVKDNPDIKAAINDLATAQDRLRSAQVRLSRSLPQSKAKKVAGNIDGIRKFANTIQLEVQNYGG